MLQVCFSVQTGSSFLKFPSLAVTSPKAAHTPKQGQSQSVITQLWLHVHGEVAFWEALCAPAVPLIQEC